MEDKETCSVEGCEIAKFVKGLCKKHYQRSIRGQSLTSPSVLDPRLAVVDGDTAQIPLGLGASQGYTLVDADRSFLDKHKWSLSNSGYATAKIDGVQAVMHRLIFTPAPGEVVDHINGDKLDNRRANLRSVTRAQNNINRPGNSNSSSRYRGVCLHKSSGRWIARIGFQGKYESLGYFDDEQQAALAYNDAARRLHGEFARLNVIEGLK